MTIILYALTATFLSSVLSTARATTPLESLAPQITQTYQRFAACQKIIDEDRETACLRQLERDAYALYKAHVNPFVQRATPRLTAAKIPTINAMTAAQGDYVMNHCRYAELAAGPNLTAARRNHARCVIRTQAESAYATLVLENGTLISAAPAGRETIRPDVAARLKDLADRAQACANLPALKERDGCVALTFADVKNYAQTAFGDVTSALTKKPAAAKLRTSYDGAQVAWTTFSTALCRTTADLHPGGAPAAKAFDEACLTRFTLARLREVYREL